MALILTSPSAIFLCAEVKILENVGLDIFISFAALICFKPSRQARRIASNSSRVRQIVFDLSSGLHNGLKHRSPGAHFIHLVFLGLKSIPSSYEHLFITILAYYFPASSEKNTTVVKKGQVACLPNRASCWTANRQAMVSQTVVYCFLLYNPISSDFSRMCPCIASSSAALVIPFFKLSIVSRAYILKK